MTGPKPLEQYSTLHKNVTSPRDKAQSRPYFRHKLMSSCCDAGRQRTISPDRTPSGYRYNSSSSHLTYECTGPASVPHHLSWTTDHKFDLLPIQAVLSPVNVSTQLERDVYCCYLLSISACWVLGICGVYQRGAHKRTSNNSRTHPRVIFFLFLFFIVIFFVKHKHGM